MVSEVNADAIDEMRKGIIANPNCTTMAAMPVLQAHCMRTLVCGGWSRLVTRRFREVAWPA